MRSELVPPSPKDENKFPSLYHNAVYRQSTSQRFTGAWGSKSTAVMSGGAKPESLKQKGVKPKPTAQSTGQGMRSTPAAAVGPRSLPVAGVAVECTTVSISVQASPSMSASAVGPQFPLAVGVALEARVTSRGGKLCSTPKTEFPARSPLKLCSRESCQSPVKGKLPRN
jgi:hypothetical protein